MSNTKQCSTPGCTQESCAGCPAAAKHKTAAKNEFAASLNELSSVKYVIAIVSGKGGVGKSSLTALLAAAMQRRGKKSAILDADITGPSIGHAFGLTSKIQSNELGILPQQSQSGIEIISANMFLPDAREPVIWRGPLLAGMVKQFWSEVIWTEIEYLFVDLPPGTGDVPLTVFQSLPVDAIIVITSPQQLVGMIVGKAVKMAQMMQVPILGLIENYAYFECPDNGKRYEIFGSSHLSETADAYALKVLARLPIEPAIAAACDQGAVESLRIAAIDAVCEYFEETLPKKDAQV